MKHNFFIICPVGFEEQIIVDINRCWPFLVEPDGKPNSQNVPELNKVKGGIELSCDLILGLQLNYFLRGAVRVLLRLASFKAKAFPELFNKVLKLDWNIYLTDKSSLNIQVSVHESRLKIKNRIEETVSKAIEEKTKTIVAKTTVDRIIDKTIEEQSIFVRIVQDQCTISLDTSGAPLFKRGHKLETGVAPIRENLAYLLLSQLIADEPLSSLQDISLIDPMCGSGTFMLEALTYLHLNKDREFSFLKWKNCPKLLKTPQMFKNYKHKIFNLFKSYHGYDISQDQVEHFAENIKNLQIEDKIKNVIEIAVSDLFDSTMINSTIKKNWVIINPPYGERVSIADNMNIYFEKIISVAQKKYQPEKIGIIVPEQVKIRAQNIKSSCDFSNGGLKVVFYVLTVN